MTGIKFPFRNITFAFAITLVLVGFTNSFSQVQAQRTRPDSNNSGRKPLRYLDLSDRGTPKGKREGAGSRDECLAAKPLTALIPTTSSGVTVAEYPTFWFYVPYQPRSQYQQEVEFVLVDENENVVYQTTFGLTNTPGIVSISLPKTVRSLESGKQYRWGFFYICDPQDRKQDVAVDGVVERVPLPQSLSGQIEAATTERERILLYAANSKWYDALTALAELRRAKPQDEAIKADWADLLKSVGLEPIASEPIVECCTPKP